MKTNLSTAKNYFRGIFVFAITILSITPVAAQNTVRQAFHYKTDFVKQMVYQLSNEVISRTGILTLATQQEVKDSEPVFVSYIISANNQDMETATFLTRAAQLNTPVATDDASYDAAVNSLEEFLTRAAQLNTPIATDDAYDAADNSLEEFLTRAAQLNTPVTSDDVNAAADNSLEEFLTRAAQLNTPVATDDENSVQVDPLKEFLIQSAQLNDRVADIE